MGKYVYFTVLAALSLVACIATYMTISGNLHVGAALSFAMNFPACLLLCMAYYKLFVWFRHMRFFGGSVVLQAAADWLCATLIGALMVVAARILLGIDGGLSVGLMAFILWNSLAVLGVELYLYHRSVLEKEAQLARIEKEKAVYQFEALKQQINPHFLFNSLNALASLAYQDAERANLFAKKLSAVYRYLLTTSDKRIVPLCDEMSFLDAYLYLERIRFGKAICVNVKTAEAALSKGVVPASLQLLVENAIKHNVATEERPLLIDITATADAVTVENNLQPRGDVASNRVGLKNLSRQYEACGASLEVEKTDTSFKVVLPLLLYRRI